MKKVEENQADPKCKAPTFVGAFYFLVSKNDISSVNIMTSLRGGRIMDTLNFTINLSILAREGETEAQTTSRLNDVLAEALLGLADHHIDYTVERGV